MPAAMKKKLTKHIHTFILKPGHKPTDSMRTKQFKCRDPHCWFYAAADMILGKAAMCSLCGQEFVLTRYALNLRIPHCENCTKGVVMKQEKAKLRSIEDKLADFLGAE